MDPHRGFHRRFLGKRQGLSGVFGNLGPPFNIGSTSGSGAQGTTSPAGSQNSGDPFGTGGIIGSLTSLVGNSPSSVSSTSEPSSATTSSSHPTQSSSSAPTDSTSALADTTSSTSSSTPSTPPEPSPTPNQASAANDVVYTSTDGTSIVYVTKTLPTTSPTATPPTSSFSHNPSMEGGVFALVGIVILIIIFVVTTWIIRQRRRRRLERDLAVAVSFDPGATDQYDRQEDIIEKHRLSGSSSGHGDGWPYAPYAVQPAYAPPPPPQPDYAGAVVYPAPVYHTPSPNSLPYVASSPVNQQASGQGGGGANLTRKFSDRKPVPPLLPQPAYNPDHIGHVSIPPQFYQQ